MGPRCADHSNPPADHGHWVKVAGGARYDNEGGCYNCGAEWTGTYMTNMDRVMAQYSVYNRMWWAYEVVRYGKTSHKPTTSVPADVKAWVMEAWPSVTVATHHVCADCPSPAVVTDGYVPSRAEADYMEACVRDRADYDREYAGSEVCHGNYYSRTPMSRPCPSPPY